MNDKMFIARDANGDLFLYTNCERPVADENRNFSGDTEFCYELDTSLCWEVRHGQCREIEITYKD